MRYGNALLWAAILLAVPVGSGLAQQKAPTDRDCDAGVARRQLTGQPMTDFMAACRAARVNPENLGKICNTAADSRNLSGAQRQSYMAECTKGPE